MDKTIITPADILLPPYDANSREWSDFAVIACDQFTSEPEYWEKAESIAAGKLSALSLILPEAYLETEKEASGKARIAEEMKSIADKLRCHRDCMVYLERTLPDGNIRRGIVGKVDLEEYDFSVDSDSAVRATEQTVIERIPPRVAVRQEASVELPHVMLLCDDTHNRLIMPLADKKQRMEKLYCFELMLGGGRAEGWKISGDVLGETLTAIAEYEKSRKNGVVYAMGDGNHSLASAAAHFKNIKKELGEVAMTHPARYALVEIVNLHDDALQFEPIYRIVKNCNPEELLGELDKAGHGGGNAVAVYAGQEKNVSVPALHPLCVGSLQMFIDKYIIEHPGAVCDYIHGKTTVKELSKEPGCVGFLFGGVEKDELFPYVENNGALPRKTFSMGEARSKRYYIEARKIR